ncbi:hypothetical protein C1645_823958 [Glomus cerebriforme]|uniref:Galactose oxidase n=1 Tax=Glomus cerebriforme TaxID=658196 RepID=A0A397SWE4_9GLOM|nr:hypothetical protein C1645_823958 [Glomus cerebriforme]
MGVGYYNSTQQNKIKRKCYRVIIIGILLSFQCVITSVDADASQERWGHASVLINNRLYVYGGKTDPKQPTPDTITVDVTNLNELLYLDVSQQFDPATPQWVVVPNSPLPSGDPLPRLAFHSCIVGGNQNELLILVGGESSEQIPGDNSLFEYNTTIELWLPPPVAKSPTRTSEHTIVTTSNSIAYLWGGTPVGVRENLVAINELYRLTLTDALLTSELLVLVNTPIGRWGHSATLLNDGKMYIIGGVTNGNILVSMINIPVFDTNNEIWTTIAATGSTIPANRRSHKAVGSGNKIVIYGGTTQDFTEKFDDIAVLNVANDGLTWEIPPVTGNKPLGRFSHSMTLVGSKAIVTYGFIDDFLIEPKLFVFDIDSYTWDQTYIPSVAGNPTNPSNPANPANPATATDVIPNSMSSGNQGASKNKNLGIIVGVPVVCGVIVLGLGGFLFLCIRKRRKQPSFSAMPYEKQQASIPPIAGPAPLYSFGSSSQGGADGTTNIAPFIPPFATSSYQRRQSSFGSTSETRNLTPVDQHDSWGSAPTNSSQSQLPQINPYYETNNYYKPSSPKATSPQLFKNTNYLPPTPPSHHHSNTPPTPPPSSPTPPPVSPQKDIFPISAAAGASSSTKTSSSNLRLDSDSNTAPVEFDFNLPPVAPLSINRTRTPSPQAQAQAQPQQQLLSPRLPISISTTSSSSSLPQDSSNVFVSSPIEMETTETTTSSTEDEGGLGGLFNSPLFRTEALSALAGTVAAASPTDRTLSLRSVPRLNTSTPRNSTGPTSPPPISADGGLRSSTLDGQRTFDGSDSGPTTLNDNNTPDDQTTRGRLFVANPDPSDESD